MVFFAPPNYLRPRHGPQHASVTFIELFFDLVFVFAVTRLSHGLLEHLTPVGLAETAFLLLAIWWVWVYTLWFTNWLEPEHTPVRVMLLVLMLAGLIMSTSLPQAFGERGIYFAGAYVFMQVSRCLFMLWALKPHSPGNFRNFQRITSWLAFSGFFWIAGGLADGNTRCALWAIALVIEYMSPAVGFWTPGLGRSTTADWDVDGHHFAERCGLFIIVALGESILVTGATFAQMDWTLESCAAFAVSFIGSVTMWWLYFDNGSSRGRRLIAESDDPGRVARLAYTYIHLPIVAGIIVIAVADELVLAHPGGHIEIETALAVLGGTGLYLVGNILFKRAVTGRPIMSHIFGLCLLVLLAAVIQFLTPLVLSAATSIVLVVVAIWERRSIGSFAAPAPH